MSRNLDWAGIALSLLCVGHCLFLPVLALLAPVYWLGLLESEWVHGLLLVLVIPIAATALIRGFYRHGHLSVIVVGGWGAVMLLLGVILGHDYPGWEVPITLVGASAFVMAHLANLMMERKRFTLEKASLAAAGGVKS